MLKHDSLIYWQKNDLDGFQYGTEKCVPLLSHPTSRSLFPALGTLHLLAQGRG